MRKYGFKVVAVFSGEDSGGGWDLLMGPRNQSSRRGSQNMAFLQTRGWPRCSDGDHLLLIVPASLLRGGPGILRGVPGGSRRSAFGVPGVHVGQPLVGPAVLAVTFPVWGSPFLCAGVAAVPAGRGSHVHDSRMSGPRGLSVFLSLVKNKTAGPEEPLITIQT